MVITNRFSISSLVLVMGALSLGCGDDGDDGDGGGDSEATFSSTLVPITAENTSTFISTPHKVSLLNEREQPLNPPVTAMTGADGRVTIADRPDDATTIYVEGVGAANVPASTYDTIIPKHNWDSGETLLRISTQGTLTLAESLSDFQANQDRAAVSGAVYWTTDGKLRKGAVGCAKIYIDGKTAPDDEQSQRYVGSTGLPAPLASQPQTVKNSGRFYIGNMTTGEHTLKVSVDDGASFIGEKTFFVGKARKDALSPTKSVIYQVGLDITAETNPQPATCQ
jgi:hypothetical protein